MDAMIKPDFVVAGGMRCATGWIRQCLMEHPDIYMARKEPHYYDRNYDKGIDWYQNFFEDYNGEKTIGEKTATYFHYSNAPRNITETNSDMKVIVCLRDPVERMFSHYSMFAKTDESLRETGFIGAAQHGTDFVQWSQYASQVKLYQKVVPSKNLKFIIYEDKDRDPLLFIQDLYHFIGVNSSYKPKSAEIRTKQGQFEHNHWFWGPVSKFLLHPRAPLSFRKLYSELRPDLKESGIPISTYETLSPYFNEIIKVEELLGRKLDCWRTRKYVTS